MRRVVLGELGIVPVSPNLPLMLPARFMMAYRVEDQADASWTQENCIRGYGIHCIRWYRAVSRYWRRGWRRHVWVEMEDG